MNDKRLKIYLDDHLALMTGEVELAGRSHSNNSGRPLGSYLSQLKDEIDTQRIAARDVLAKINGSESDLKKGAVWLAEKVARFKLNDAVVSYSDLSRVDELEGLLSGAQERIFLWETLEALSEGDPRLVDVPHSFYLEQTRRHTEQLKEERRKAAAEAFS